MWLCMKMITICKTAVFALWHQIMKHDEWFNFNEQASVKENGSHAAWKSDEASASKYYPFKM